MGAGGKRGGACRPKRSLARAVFRRGLNLNEKNEKHKANSIARNTHLDEVIELVYIYIVASESQFDAAHPPVL